MVHVHMHAQAENKRLSNVCRRIMKLDMDSLL